jgi:hypothetical protein
MRLLLNQPVTISTTGVVMTVTVALTIAPTVIVLKTHAMGSGSPVVQTVTVAPTTVRMVIAATHALSSGSPVVQTVTVAPTTVTTVIVINTNVMGPGSLVVQTVTVAPSTVTKALVSKRRRYHGCRSADQESY